MFVFYLPVVLTVVLICALYYYFTRTFNYWKSRNVPGPEPTVLVGNLKESTFRRKNIGLVMHDLYNAFPDEKVVGIYRMTTPCLLIRDLEIVKHIMIKDFEAFADRGIYLSKQGLGQNLFHADAETWRPLRNRFTPIFTSGKLKNMFYLIDEGADAFVKHVSTECETRREFEVLSLLQTYTMSTISACAFGVNYDSLSDKKEILDIIDKFLTQTNFAVELDMMYQGLLRKTGIPIIPTVVVKFFRNLVDTIISQRNGKPSGRNDFMDLILELREVGQINSSKFGDSEASVEITEDVMAAQAFAFYIGGYDTSATTMSYLLYQLALNPDIQHKLTAEIDTIIEANNGKVTYESLKEMKYLNKALDETLRMYSVVEPLQRKATRDYQIPGTDVVVEKDMVVLIPSRGIHYDEKYYTKPEVFNPDRFDPEEVGKRHPCAYLPFGLGQRNCIGLRFGKLQSLLGIAKILSKFTVEASKNTNRNLEVSPNRLLLGPKDGILVNIVPRTFKS